MLKKIPIALVLIAAIGTGSYAAREASQLREQARSIRNQQAPVRDQIQKLQREHDESVDRLTSLFAENARLKSASPAAEIQKLRTELARLQTVETNRPGASAEPAVNAWLSSVEKLKQYIDQHPDASIPEFQYLTDREWLLIAPPGRSEADFTSAVEDLKSQAITRFASPVQDALKKYSAANDGQFPRDLAQLNPYCDPTVIDILQLRYEIKPASVLPATSVKFQDIKTDWVIATKEPVASNTADHLAIYTHGYAYFW